MMMYGGDEGACPFENINLYAKLNVHSFDILTVDSFVFYSLPSHAALVRQT